jgi:hypothetical protein
VPGWLREAWAPLTALAVTLAVAIGADPPLVGIVVLGAAAYACGAYARIVPGAAGIAAMLAAALLAGADDFVPVTITALGPWLAGRVVRSRPSGTPRRGSRSATSAPGSRASCMTSSPTTWR